MSRCTSRAQKDCHMSLVCHLLDVHSLELRKYQPISRFALCSGFGSVLHTQKITGGKVHGV